MGMRPKLLEIEGLQSFQKVQRIHFDTLGETGLFGIFGPTGSGKSTVLDAITLALYGRVKRAERGTQGIINTNSDSLRVAFTFELLQGNQRKTYRVERSFQRKKGSENSCEPKVVRLIEVTPAGEVPLCDKTTEVTNRIEALLGLGHDDFTRAVVLPQNSFQEFLFLENSKKREMLERIFYLEEYGRQLLDKLSRKMSETKSRLDQLSGEVSGYSDATDEALMVSLGEAEAAAAEKNQVENDFKVLETQITEAREVWQYTQDLDLILQREAQHTLQQEEINEKRIILEKAIKAEAISESIQKTADLEARLCDTDTKLKQVLEALPAAEDDLHRLQQEYEALRKETSVEIPRLVGYRTRLADALVLQGEIASASERLSELDKNGDLAAQELVRKTTEYQNKKNELENLAQTIARQQSELSDLSIDPDYRARLQLGVKLESELETRRRTLKELENKAADLSTVVSALEKRLKLTGERLDDKKKALEELGQQKQQHEAVMPEGREKIEAFRARVDALKNTLEILKIRWSELQQTDQRLIGLEASLRNYSEDVNELQRLLDDRRTAYEHNRMHAEEIAALLRQNTAYLLSQNLNEGDPCPVCGSTHHPSPATRGDERDNLDKGMEEAQKKLQESEKALREAENSLLILNEQLNACMLQRDQALRDKNEKLQQLSQLRQTLDEPFQTMEPEQLEQELNRWNHCLLEKVKALESWQKKRDEIQTMLQELNEAFNKESLLENGLTAELGVNRENLKQHQGTLNTAKTELSGVEKEYSRFLKEMNIEGVSAELEKLAGIDKQAELLKIKVKQNQDLMSTAQNALERMREAIQELKDSALKLQSERNSLYNQISEKEVRVKALSGDKDIEEQIRQTDMKLAEYDTLEKQRRERLAELDKQVNALLNEKTALEHQRRIHDEHLRAEEKALSVALSAKGFVSREEAKMACISPEQQKLLKDEIAEYDQKAINLRAEKEIVLKKLKNRTITEEEWNALDSRFQQTLAWKEACVTRCEVAKTNYEKTKARHSQWVQLSQSHAAFSRKYDLYLQIQKLLKAERSKDNSFIDYIAEERLRFVVAKASDILGVMTKYRYALELDTQSGFIIRDNANGGAHRMVTTLSGGETFLTALSLALALSEQIQLKGQSPLEFFFLDEGFGTLDSSLLDTVLDSLERLSSTNRVIGIISHVPELRHRIARRLIVTPPNNSAEGSQVQIEKA